MMRTTSHLRWLVFGLMMAFGFAPAVTHAEIIIPKGTDFLFTIQPTFKDLGDPLGIVVFGGVPTFQFGTDTVVERLEDANATTGAQIQTQITGLALMGNSSVGPVFADLDPNHLADDKGTMSFLATSPIIPNALQTVSGTITDTLDLFWRATVPGIPPIVKFGEEHFVSQGTWEGILRADQNGQGIVTDFMIIIDSHVDPSGQHTVTAFPEPSTWIMLGTACVMVPGYARWRRRRS